MDDLKGFIGDTVQVVLWALLVAAAAAVGLHCRKSKTKTGWTLYKLILAAIICQALYAALWAVHNDAVRSVGLGRLTDTLYRVYIPFKWLATCSFMGLLLLLAGGYCITRNNLGDYKGHIIGLPILLFVTGVVTDLVNFQVLDASSDQLDLFELAGWEQGLWFICTVLNLAAFAFWVVYIFEVIQLEVDALRAQQELNLVRNAAPTATVSPFPPQQQPFPAAGGAHAGPPPGLDPDWTAAAAEEGVVAYKNLLGPGQNMSHIPGASGDGGGEITTVADAVNFEVKASMYRRFSNGFGVFVLAYTCVTLSPVFVIDIVQDVIWFFQFVVTWGYLAVLLWAFRPVEDSPYLMMGDDDLMGQLDTCLVDEDEPPVEVAALELTEQQQQQRWGGQGSKGPGGPLPAAGDSRAGGRDQAGASGRSSQQQGGGSSGNGLLPVSRSARDLGAALGSPAALVADPPVSLPAIRTSVGGRPDAAASRQQPMQPIQQQQQPGGAAAVAAPQAAPKWSLDDGDELHEMTLHAPEKRD